MTVIGRRNGRPYAAIAAQALPSGLIEKDAGKGWLRCPNCGESSKSGAKFCSDCGTRLSLAALGGAQDRVGPAVGRPLAPPIISLVSAIGMLAVALSMSFTDDAPGYVGSRIAALFHAVGAVQFVLGLGVFVSGIFLLLGGYDVKRWGAAILALGLVSIVALLVMVLEGTFAVIFLAIPGLLAIVAGALGRRAAAQPTVRAATTASE